jgi:apolipoprotein N-acyltransferase
LDDVDVLVNFTNLGWFGDGAAQWQHASAAVFRAVENRRPIIRATNNGVTCWIDSLGCVRQVFRDASGGIYGPGFLIAEVGIDPVSPRTPTFYRKHGEVFGWSCVVVSAAWVAALFRRKRSGPVT